MDKNILTSCGLEWLAASLGSQGLIVMVWRQLPGVVWHSGTIHILILILVTKAHKTNS